MFAGARASKERASPRREKQMKANLSLALAAASLLGASGCIVERERIPDRARVPAPPPPDEGYAEPRADASAYADAPAPGIEVDEDVFYARLSP
jgi:hypothetical protein